MHVMNTVLVLLAIAGSGRAVDSAETPAPLRFQQRVDIDQEAWRFNTASFDQDKIHSFGDFQYTLYWDADKLQFTNSEAANQLMDPPYREGWSLL